MSSGWRPTASNAFSISARRIVTISPQMPSASWPVNQRPDMILIIPPRIDNMPGPSPGGNHHHIKAQGAFGKGGIASQIEFGGAPDANARFRRHRFEPRRQIAAMLDLDEGDDVAAPGDK